VLCVRIDGAVRESEVRGPAQTLRIDVKSYHTSRAEETGAGHRAQADRTSADHRHAVARRERAQLSSEVAAGKNIAEEESVLIRHRIRNARKPRIGKRHADILRLASVDAATKLPASPLTVVDIAAAAEPAVAAEGDAV